MLYSTTNNLLQWYTAQLRSTLLLLKTANSQRREVEIKSIRQWIMEVLTLPHQLKKDASRNQTTTMTATTSIATSTMTPTSTKTMMTTTTITSWIYLRSILNAILGSLRSIRTKVIMGLFTNDLHLSLFVYLSLFCPFVLQKQSFLIKTTLF